MSKATDYLVRYGTANAIVAELLTVAVNMLDTEIHTAEIELCELERDGESRELRLAHARRHALIHERSVLAAEADRTTETVASVFGQEAVKRGEIRDAIHTTVSHMVANELSS